jgi:hypothetical protein
VRIIIITVTVILSSACAPSTTDPGHSGTQGFTSQQTRDFNYRKLLAEQNGWRVWELAGQRSGKFRIAVGADQSVTCVAVKPVPGTPWPDFSEDGRFLSGGAGFYMSIADSQSIPYFGFYGKHPYRWQSEVKVNGATVSDPNNRATVLSWEGRKVAFTIATQPSPENYEDVHETTGVVDMTGIGATFQLMMACHGRNAARQ